MNRVDKPVTIITPRPDFRSYWSDCLGFRELMFLLVWRDVLVRYKQTIFGVAWALVRPFITMVVFTIVFGHLANLPSHHVPYPLLVFAGMLPWQFFSNTFVEASNSLLGNANMISKVYFPRIIIPISTIFVGLVDFTLSGIIYAGLALWYGFPIHWQILLLPFFILQLCLLILGCGLWISALNVEYRDFRYIIPFVIQLGTYISPVGFSSSIVPEKWRLLFAFNPMVGIIDGFRWSLLGASEPLNLLYVIISVTFTFVLLIPGFYFFRRLERGFADII
jgi:lipopolysaccharide transport system permease protein